MARNHPTDFELLAFFLAYIREHSSARGMMQAAAVHFRVDRRTIHRWVGGLRQRRQIGRGVFRAWRDAG